MLTGEPVPQQKGEGESVHAGTVVQDGSVLFRASAVGSHTTLSRINSHGAPGPEPASQKSVSWRIKSQPYLYLWWW